MTATSRKYFLKYSSDEKILVHVNDLRILLGLTKCFYFSILRILELFVVEGKQMKVNLST